jgi:hypothetical protein
MGVEVVSFTLRPVAIYHQEDSCYSFLLQIESTPGLEGLDQLKIPITSLGIETVTFRLVAEYATA